MRGCTECKMEFISRFGVLEHIWATHLSDDMKDDVLKFLFDMLNPTRTTKLREEFVKKFDSWLFTDPDEGEEFEAAYFVDEEGNEIENPDLFGDLFDDENSQM